MKAKPDTVIKSAHVGMAASNTYLFLTDVLPRAIKKYGGITSEALRKAALDTDLPDGDTMLGFGVKFEPPGQPMAGQNERAYPGRRPIRRRQGLCGLAEGAAAARAGAEVAGDLALRPAVTGLPRAGGRWACPSALAASPLSTTSRSESIRAKFSA